MNLLADDANANADPLTDTRPNAGATQAFRRWTLEEDAKLTRAVTNTSKKKWGKEYKTDWAAAAALIPGRTSKQCWNRWHTLDPSIDRASGRKGKWSAIEDSKLKDAVQTHGDKDWGTISALVPGRTRNQCNQRWYYAMKPSIAPAAGRTGKWEEDEDSKLKDAIQTQGDNDWAVIAALVPGRTRHQCRDKWNESWIPSSTERMDVRVNGQQSEIAS
jgi:myb proto-oncogene protein